MKAIDLFAGCGGLSLGLQNSGIDIVQAFDNWEKSNEIYQKNFDHQIQNIDLSNTKESIKQISEFEFDLIAGGPPCQDFSSAGKRDVCTCEDDELKCFCDDPNCPKHGSDWSLSTVIENKKMRLSINICRIKCLMEHARLRMEIAPIHFV